MLPFCVSLCYHPTHPAPIRGTFRPIVTRRGAGCDGRGCIAALMRCWTNDTLRTAKACGPGALVAGANPRVEEPEGTVTQKPVSPGRARYKPLTPLRRECRCFGFTCSDYACVLSLIRTQGCGCSPRPAFPVPSAFARDTRFQTSGRSRRENEKSRPLHIIKLHA